MACAFARGLSAWTLCLISLHGLSVWTLCLDSLCGLSVWTLWAPKLFFGGPKKNFFLRSRVLGLGSLKHSLKQSLWRSSVGVRCCVLACACATCMCAHVRMCMCACMCVCMCTCVCTCVEGEGNKIVFPNVGATLK